MLGPEVIEHKCKAIGGDKSKHEHGKESEEKQSRIPVSLKINQEFFDNSNAKKDENHVLGDIGEHSQKCFRHNLRIFIDFCFDSLLLEIAKRAFYFFKSKYLIIFNPRL